MTKIESIVKRVEEEEQKSHFDGCNSDRYQKITDACMEEYQSLSPTELLTLVLRKDSDSQRALYYLLTVTLRNDLKNAFNQVFFFDGEYAESYKTFEDYLSDFYMYLYLGHPQYVDKDVRFFYLSRIGDPNSVKSWMYATFKHFLHDEQETLSKLQNALDQYKQQLVTMGKGSNLGITMMHIAFAIAQFNQNETELDRYIFFRKLYREYADPEEWMSELSDREAAKVLGLNDNAFRTRSSRLFKKVKNEIRNITNAKIATLDKASLDLARKIYCVQDPDIEKIVKALLEAAEKELPQYKEIKEIKFRKDLMNIGDAMIIQDGYEAGRRVNPQARIISIFENVIGWNK